MKDDIFQNIFRLAVRLAGLLFFCLGLKALAVQTFMALTQFQDNGLVGIFGAFFPPGFYLVVAVWFLRGKSLIRMAYPQTSQIIGDNQSATRPATSPAATPQKLSEMETAEKKLAALVGKPNDNRGT